MRVLHAALRRDLSRLRATAAQVGGLVTLLIGVPGGIEEYFRDLHRATGGREVRQVQEKYGITVL